MALRRRTLSGRAASGDGPASLLAFIPITRQPSRSCAKASTRRRCVSDDGQPSPARGRADNPAIAPPAPSQEPPPAQSNEPPPPVRVERAAPGADAPGPLARALERIGPGENAAGVVYGIIVIGALLAAESDRHDTYVDTVSSTVIAAALYWLAHAYAGVLGSRLTLGRRLSVPALARALADDWAIMLGAAVPLLALVLCWAVGATLNAAVTAALWSAIASLIAFELLAGARSRATPRELALDLAVGSIMGLAILALKIVLH